MIVTHDIVTTSSFSFLPPSAVSLLAISSPLHPLHSRFSNMSVSIRAAAVRPILRPLCLLSSKPLNASSSSTSQSLKLPSLKSSSPSIPPSFWLLKILKILVTHLKPTGLEHRSHRRLQALRTPCDHRLWEGMCESGNGAFWVNPQVALEEHAPPASLLIPIIAERCTYLAVPPAPALSVPCWACPARSMIAVAP
ncbi:hypothetical protein K438DRAFT_2029600 [Mycena galopus ATCC 62051]|nr:hypothetical protein K438DRAFT_2029600 [Mycena galopus ATCC 62051]